MRGFRSYDTLPGEGGCTGCGLTRPLLRGWSLPKSTLPKVKTCQVLWAGVNRYASRPPAKKSQPSQRMFFGPVLAGSSPSPHPTLSSHQPGRRAGFQEGVTFFLSSFLLAGAGQGLCSPEQSPGPGLPGPPATAPSPGRGDLLPRDRKGTSHSKRRL